MEKQPGSSVEPIGGARNTDLRKAIQGTTLSLLRRENDFRGMSNEEKKMMERSMVESGCLGCGRLTKNPSGYCDSCI